MGSNPLFSMMDGNLAVELMISLMRRSLIFRQTESETGIFYHFSQWEVCSVKSGLSSRHRIGLISWCNLDLIRKPAISGKCQKVKPQKMEI